MLSLAEEHTIGIGGGHRCHATALGLFIVIPILQGLLALGHTVGLYLLAQLFIVDTRSLLCQLLAPFLLVGIRFYVAGIDENGLCLHRAFVYRLLQYP